MSHYYQPTIGKYVQHPIFLNYTIRSHYPERRRNPRFGHSDVVFLSIFSMEHQNVPPINHQQNA